MRSDKAPKVTLSCSRPRLRLGIAGTPSSWLPQAKDALVKTPAKKR
jgi:hypothetical protein